jgi:hypothetical protein
LVYEGILAGYGESAEKRGWETGKGGELRNVRISRNMGSSQYSGF